MASRLLGHAARFASVCLALLTGCIDAGTEESLGSGESSVAEARPITFLSYNVGGLADFISSGTPSEAMPLISPLLNPFELVVVQEDFAYHEKLASELTHPFQVAPAKATFPNFYGDGLAIFSRRATAHVERRAWQNCNGTLGSKNDCLARKGLLRAVVALAPNVEVDVYSIHMDAGRGEGDAKARDDQAKQLAEFLNLYSNDRPVIVAGDTNMKASDEASLRRMLAITSLRDACRELQCPRPELHDRIFVRDGWAHKLTPSKWRIETGFETADGTSLSDHDPIAVDISWSKVSIRASTEPAPGSGGFTLVGTPRLMNGTGVCAQASSVPLGTAACSDADSQTFAVYQMPDGAFELCLRDTLRLANAGSPLAEYRATCLSRTGDTELRFLATTLSTQSTAGFRAEPGHITTGSDGTLGWKDSNRKLTRNSAGTVVLARPSGAPDQKWSTF